ncbi:dienelactone hydrolase family protein [Candidatus Uhrbacteria bacterium]|nr:dienelactone hydrolase family protein [Candidatus Uhrbacteria bacterium]
MKISKHSLLLIGLGAVIIGALALSDRRSAAPPAATNASALKNAEAVAVRGENVAYFGDRKGYFVGPDDAKAYPGVVMIHEWWGLNDNIRAMARELAGRGYLVLAVDLYGKVAADQAEARAAVGALDQKDAIDNMRAAMEFLRRQGATKMASLGWCFGGGQSLQLALNERLDATVIYYGNLVTDEKALANITWPVLGVFGDQDQAIPVSGVRTFEASLKKLGVPGEIHVYPGVGHAFANPSGANYAPKETADAWAKTLDFLARNLR